MDEEDAPAASSAPASENEHGVKAAHVKSPLSGEVIKLEEVQDKAFSSGALGKGAAIIPSEGKLFAPVTGVVTTVFPTGHAYGLTSESGAEVLIHIGLDTVQLGAVILRRRLSRAKPLQKVNCLRSLILRPFKQQVFLSQHL